MSSKGRTKGYEFDDNPSIFYRMFKWTGTYFNRKSLDTRYRLEVGQTRILML